MALAVIAIAIGLASPASSRPVRVVPLRLHGTISLSGSKILCGSGHLKGLTYVDCGVGDASGQPKRGSYVALMAADGRVNIVSATTLKTLFSRAPAGVARTRVGTPVQAGDRIAIPGTRISCNADDVSGVPTVFCDYVDKRGVVRPHSYAFGISDSIVTALGWDGARHAHLLRSWSENG